MAPILSLDGLDKSYGPVHAVAGASLSFELGRIHAVVGENGAGKSTLLKMAAGLVVPDRGHVRIDDVRLEPHSAREAIARGVAIVEQHFGLIGAFTALENAVLGFEPVRAMGAIDTSAARSRAESVARDLGVALSWDEPVERLAVGDRQRVAMVRALLREPRVIVLDEPTAVLTPGEVSGLYAMLRRIADAGNAVIVVTHRLDEVRDHADVVSTIRRGTVVSTRAVRRGDADAILVVVRDMMGNDPPPEIRRRASAIGPVGIEVVGLRRGSALRDVTFHVGAGEIVGIAGVEGNGQRELVRVLSGLEPADGGHVRAGEIAVVHEDRHAEGLALDAPVRDNVVLGELARFTRFAVIDRAALEREAARRVDGAHVVPPDLAAPARALSGGNQQKIVVARALARAERGGVLVLAQPTRGVDMGAASAIRAQIAAAADAGTDVLLVSADLAELRALCDRILVMARGRIVAELSPEATDARFGEAMLGGSAQAGGPA